MIEQLQKLSKPELISLISARPFCFEERDLRRVKFDAMCARARRMAEEAQREMVAAYGNKRFPEYQVAMRKFERAITLYDRANALLQVKP